MEYGWPGNIRELEHVIEGAILLSTGEVIQEADLSMYVHRSDKPIATDTQGVVQSEIPSGTTSLEELERIHIERVLKQYNYSRTRTADALGISKKTLYLKIKRYGMKLAE